MAELKRLASHCSFEAYLDEALRDRFVFGLKETAIQKRLLAEKNLSFTTAVEIAQSMEKVDTQAKFMKGERRGLESEIQKVYLPNSKGGGTQCYCCGRSNHIHSQCRIKDAVCHCYKKCGHLQVMCQKKAEQISTEPTRLRPVMKAQKQNNSKMKWMSVSDDEDSLALFNLLHGESPPYQVKVLINNKNVLMEIDTGAAVTLMSINEFRGLFSWRQLQKSKLTLKTYMSEELQIVGKTDVTVTYQSQRHHLKLVVVEGVGPALMGRDWLVIVKLDWSKVCCTSGDGKVKPLLEKYKEVFTGNLGTMTEHVAKLHLKGNPKPRFWRPRPVPFALKKSC